MTDSTVEVSTCHDGTLVIQPHGCLGAGEAVDLRRALVQAIRHTRPLRLVLDLDDVNGIDAINVGTLAAACALGDDNRVAVFLDHSLTEIADQLTAAGVPVHRLRHIRTSPQATPRGTPISAGSLPG